MKNKNNLLLGVCLLALLVVGIVAALDQVRPTQGKGLSASPLVALGSGFQYQGRLTNGGTPANGLHDFTFKLFDASSGGNQVGTTITLTNRTVNNGLFTVSLDFGDNAFLGEARWLQMAARVAGVGSFVTLSPRQRLLPVPYSQSATWFGVSNKPYPYGRERQANVSTVITDIVVANDQSAVTIGADGLPFVVYWGAGGAVGNSAANAAHCDNLECTSFTTVPVTVMADDNIALTLGRDGLPIFATAANVGNPLGLKVVHCNNIECTNSTETIIDGPTSPGTGRDVSITIGNDGLALLSYASASSVGNGDLKVAHCSNVSCTSATLTALDTTNNTGWYTSITTGADGLGLISYYDLTNGELKIAHCSNANCTAATITPLGVANGGINTSIATGSDGLGIFTFRGSALSVGHCDDALCSSATITTVDNSSGDIGRDPAITIGPDGLAMISYWDRFNFSTKVANCQNLACTSATTRTIDDRSGQLSSITWGIDGLPLFTHYDGEGAATHPLKVVHCGSSTCAGNQMAR